MTGLEHSERKPAGVGSRIDRAKKYAITLFALSASIGASVLAQADITEAGFKSQKRSRIEEIAKETDDARAEWEYLFDTGAGFHVIEVLGDLDPVLASEIANSRNEIVHIILHGDMEDNAAKELCNFSGSELSIEVEGKWGENALSIIKDCPSPSAHASSQLSSQSTP